MPFPSSSSPTAASFFFCFLHSHRQPSVGVQSKKQASALSPARAPTPAASPASRRIKVTPPRCDPCPDGRAPLTTHTEPRCPSGSIPSRTQGCRHVAPAVPSDGSDDGAPPWNPRLRAIRAQAEASLAHSLQPPPQPFPSLPRSSLPPRPPALPRRERKEPTRPWHDAKPATQDHRKRATLHLGAALRHQSADDVAATA
jgi:hypothetical protein